MKYSVIVLLDQEHPGFSQFVRNLHELFARRGESFEILIVANGTGGFLRHHLSGLSPCRCMLKAYELNAGTSQAVCLKAAFNESAGEIIVVCEGYRQITDDAFQRLLDSIEEDVDIISPWRVNRLDPPVHQMQSRMFNAFVRRIMGTDLHDLNCNVKIFRRKILEEVELYGNMYRFLPILARRKGFRVLEVPCEHDQPADTLRGWGPAAHLSRLVDIATLFFNTRFSKKPLRFFSAVGLIFLSMGMVLFSYVFLEKIFAGTSVGGRPVLLLGILFMVLGVQAASVGLLGEVVAFTHGRKKKEYSIEKIVQ